MSETTDLFEQGAANDDEAITLAEDRKSVV